MMKNFKIFSFIGTILALVDIVCGGGVGCLLAAATGVPTGTVPTGAGDETVTTNSGASGPQTATQPYGGHDGVATETEGRAVYEADDAEMYQNDIEEKILKVRPMSTPVDQISRYASNKHVDSFVVQFYSVGTRPVKTTVLKAFASSTMTGTSAKLEVQDPSLFTKDDTIFVPSVDAVTDCNGVAYDENAANTPCLELIVCGRDTDGQPLVYAVNGTLKDGQAIKVPDIAVGAVLIRGGKACGELDVQTGRFHNYPMPETQYLQNFMLQVEQSTFDKIAAKKVKWDFSDIEEDAVYDFRRTQEKTFMFGTKNKIKHDTKEGALTWTTGGIWWMAGKDIEVGTYNTTSKVTTISDDDLVDIAKDLFVGTGVGDKRKILLCGSEMLAALSKIESEKFRLKDTVEVWDLKFKSWDTDFGECLTIFCEAMDDQGLADCAFALDPSYLGKRTHVNFGRTVLDLKKAGVRNTDAVVFQEVSGLILRYPAAHARMKLANS